jgi:hypothetical protein
VIKFLLRLALVALVANATWQAFVVYSAHYRFTDAVESASQYGAALTTEELRQRVVDLAKQYGVPERADSISVMRDGTHTVIDGSYARPVQLIPFPSYSYDWPFTWHVDTTTTKTPTGTPLR